MKEEAEDLLKEIEIASKNPSTEEADPGFVSSYCIYPAATAYSYALICFPALPLLSHGCIASQDNRILSCTNRPA